MPETFALTPRSAPARTTSSRSPYACAPTTRSTSEGAAMVARLVLNATSPLYGAAPVTLRFVARSARLALDPP